MYLYIYSPKTLLTVTVAFAVALAFEPTLGGSSVAFSLVGGLALPVVDGLLWGKDRWDQHPLLYVFVGVLYFVLQLVIGRYERAFSSIWFGVGAISMQALLYYLGKTDKNA